MDTAHAFRTAMAAHRAADAAALLAPDVVFASPVVYGAYHGRDQVLPILDAVTNVIGHFAYGATYRSDDGGVILAFSGTVGGRDLEGVDILRFDAAGSISELRVMMRPLSGLTALQQAMAERLQAPDAATGDG
jgi:hypothetical protein